MIVGEKKKPAGLTVEAPDRLYSRIAVLPPRREELIHKRCFTFVMRTRNPYRLVKSEQERTAVNQGYAAARAMLSKWEGDLRAGVPEAKIVELPGANLYMFLSNEADVIRELRAFAASLR